MVSEVLWEIMALHIVSTSCMNAVNGYTKNQMETNCVMYFGSYSIVFFKHKSKLSENLPWNFRTQTFNFPCVYHVQII